MHREQSTITITLSEAEVPHLRETVRQQLLGDIEHMKDIMSGHEDPECRWDLGNRIRFLRRIGEQLGLPENLDDVDRRRRAHPYPFWVRLKRQWAWLMLRD